MANCVVRQKMRILCILELLSQVFINLWAQDHQILKFEADNITFIMIVVNFIEPLHPPTDNVDL